MFLRHARRRNSIVNVGFWRNLSSEKCLKEWEREGRLWEACKEKDVLAPMYGRVKVGDLVKS